MTYNEMYHRKFERNPQRRQLSIHFETTMEQVFETLETANIDTTTIYSPNMVKPIVNRNFENTFHHQKRSKPETPQP